MSEQNSISTEPIRLVFLTKEEIKGGAERLSKLFEDRKFLDQFKRFVEALPKNIREMVIGNRTGISKPLPEFEKGAVSPDKGESYITPIQNQPTQPKRGM
ncbi:hypothetical protein GW881_03375 [Candidatus Roizmanbacteria bacterium]|nr:hypothetical protein [Candidatus Roizmanbacteria bacterium]